MRFRLTVLLLLLCAQGVEARSLLRFVPDESDEAPPRQGEHWIQEGPQVTLLVSRMETEARRAWLREQIGAAVDPFHSPADAEKRFLSFLLVIENRGDSAVSFNPRKAWLSTSKGPVFTPLGLADLRFDFRVLGGEMPPAYEKLSTLVFENPVEIPAGGAISGLLVYRPVDVTNKRFTVDVVVDVGPETIEMTVPYRRIKIKLDRDGNPIEGED